MTVEIHSGNYTIGSVNICIELTADSRGLTACQLLPRPMLTHTPVKNPHLKKAIEELTRYFSGNLKKFRTQLAPDGTPFQKKVWEATRQIPYGQVQSYMDIARAIGNPRATRAVAQALGANPLLLYVPCHRVTRHNGELGGFSCGIEWKLRFHELEGISISTPAFIN